MSKFNNSFFSKIIGFGYETFGAYTRITGKYTPYMNLGYPNEVMLHLKEEDEFFRPNMNLYNKVLNGLDLANKSVLEVGCGRGGGCYFYKKYKDAKWVYGLDRSKQNIKLCNKYFAKKECNFIEADATNFHFDQKFDYVVNLESSHSYPSLLQFYSCVNKVMKEESLFLYADIFVVAEMKEVEQQMNQAALEIAYKENITDQVIRSIDENSIKWFPLSTKYPKLFPKFFKNFTASKHSDIFNNMVKGEYQYYYYILKKKS